MLDSVMTTALENIEGTDDVAAHGSVRVLESVPSPGLGRQMHDPHELLAREEPSHGCIVRKIHLHEAEERVRQSLETGLLQRDVVVGIEIVEPDHLVAV